MNTVLIISALVCFMISTQIISVRIQADYKEMFGKGLGFRIVLAVILLVCFLVVEAMILGIGVYIPSGIKAFMVSFLRWAIVYTVVLGSMFAILEIRAKNGKR